MNKNSGKHMKVEGSSTTVGKRMKNNNLLSKNISIIILIILLTFVAGTSAYLMLKSSINNEFTLGEVNPEIIEEFDAENKVKENVKIKNSGNIPIFVRTAIIIIWKDSNGKILADIPEENVDYSISFSSSTNWIKSEEGYYYYIKPLDVNESTDILIEECTQIQEYDDKVLEVSIITQGIQDKPFQAVEEAWNVNIINNRISLGGQ